MSPRSAPARPATHDPPPATLARTVPESGASAWPRRSCGPAAAETAAAAAFWIRRLSPWLLISPRHTRARFHATPLRCTLGQTRARHTRNGSLQPAQARVESVPSSIFNPQCLPEPPLHAIAAALKSRRHRKFRFRSHAASSKTPTPPACSSFFFVLCVRTSQSCPTAKCV